MNEMAFNLASWVPGLVCAIVFHEVAHGRVAKMLGDMTAANAGRLSLNPIRHIDPFGTLLLPAFLAISGLPIFGWARPVPVRQSQLRNPRWHMVLVAAAGPVINIVLAFLAATLLGLTIGLLPNGEGNLAAALYQQSLENFIAVNLFLAVFNMLPVPPFDGSKILAGFLPPPLALKYQSLDRFALVIMLMLLVGLPWLFPNANLLQKLVVPPVAWFFDIINALIANVASLG